MSTVTATPPRPRRKVRARAVRVHDAIDGTVFFVAGLLVLWLGWVLVTRSLTFSWQTVVSFVLYWLLLAYVALPRVQEMLAHIYVPDYFIGRTLTGQGILGDPVNLALDGSVEQLHESMTKAGWTKADEITLGSSWGIVVSSVLRRSYPAAPVSPLLLFGRRQDVAYQQEVDGSATQRHHVRFWPVPEDWVLPGGRRVGWLGAGTYDRAVGLSLFTLQVTHKIDADVDVERDYVVSTVRRHNPAATVDVIENFSTAFHSRNGGGDLVHTDGNLPVLDVSAVEVSHSHDAEPPPPVAFAAKPVARHHFPPPQLLLAGVMSMVKTGFALTADFSTKAADQTLLTTGLTAAAMVALWALTLARKAWARLLLMAVCLVEAITRLIALSEATRGHYYLALSTGLSLLVLIAVSSTSARRWVS